ncbi:MAG TPA: HhH-GPD-type base excision DNA repair protein [Acidimicrobiales bacterium]|nr:HhH-GPD-type base excision DNA repair protein [Acidimicrobiales bacterium]
MPKLALSGVPEADRLLADDPLALLIGMVLDQQIPLEHAFHSPYELTQRLGRRPTAQQLASFDPDELAAIFAKPRALHRFPGSMAKRVQEMCRVVVDEYGGDAAAVWNGASTGDELYKRVAALPGFGQQKAKIFVALLGKQLSVRPKGWREASTPYGEAGTKMSVADITSPASLLEVREYKRAKKAEAKAAAEKAEAG